MMNVSLDYKEYKNITDVKIVAGKQNPNRVVFRMGNCVVDVYAGHQTGRAVIDVYPYEDEKPYGFFVNDNRQQGVYWRDEKETSQPQLKR